MYNRVKRLFTFLVIIALILPWLSGCDSSPVEDRLLLPVNFSNVPDGFVLTAYFSDRIEIKIKGSARLIAQAVNQNITYPVDLYTDLELDPAGASTSIEPGVYLIPLIKKRIPLNPAISILEINPVYLSVKLEEKISRRFNVLVPYTGKPPTGYIAMEAKAEPAAVDLTGARSVVSGIKTLRTKPIDLDGVTESFKTNIPLDLDTSLPVEPASRIIKVSVPIKHKTISRTIENIPVEARNAGRGARAAISPDCITIDIKGRYEDVNNKDIQQQIHAFMDLDGLKPGVYARNASIVIPVGLVMVKADPEVFTVKIETGDTDAAGD